MWKQEMASEQKDFFIDFSLLFILVNFMGYDLRGHGDYSLFSKLVWCWDSGKWGMRRKEKDGLGSADRVDAHLWSQGHGRWAAWFQMVGLAEFGGQPLELCLSACDLLTGHVHAIFLHNVVIHLNLLQWFEMSHFLTLKFYTIHI